MNATIAAIFRLENPYSIAPYARTLAALTTISSAENVTIHQTPGTFANQYFM
jgi:hypothetical protein